MLDINLFPQKYRKRIGKIYNPKYAPIAFTVAVLLCLTAYNITNLESQLIKDRQNELTEKSNAISSQVATVNGNNRQIDQIKQSFIAASERWRGNSIISKYIEAIGESTESDVWIDKLTYSNQQISTQSPTEATVSTQNTAISDSTIVYYVDGSKTFHLDKDCSELKKNNKTVQSKTYKEVKSLGFDECEVCKGKAASSSIANNTSTANTKDGISKKDNTTNKNTTVDVQPLSPTASAGTYFVIHGYSFSYKGISQLIKNLKDNGLSYCEITSLNEKEYEEKVGYIEFEVSCSTVASVQNSTDNTSATTQSATNNSPTQTSSTTKPSTTNTSTANTTNAATTNISSTNK